MLISELKPEILEIIEIVKAVPEKLQEKCFELLMRALLENGERPRATKSAPKEPVRPERKPTTEEEGEDEVEEDPIVPKSNGDQDIAITDIHLKARKFLSKYQLGIGDLNELFYLSNGNFEPLYEDLKSTKIAESQVRIGLLLALKNALKTGDFIFSGEEVRQQCQIRKCYDAGNFSANMNNNSSLFDGFDKYDKTKPEIRLSEVGRERLANLVRELK